MTPRTPDDLPVPDLILERYRLGEMSAAEIEEIRRRLEMDEGLRDRLQALSESDGEIARRYPPGWLAERIRERLGRVADHPSPGIGWRFRIAAAAAAVVVIAVGWHLFDPLSLQPGVTPPAVTELGDRIKGDTLVLFRRTADGSEMLADGARVRAGDQIRIGYRGAGPSYGVILSIDGRGVVTRHYPLRGELAAPLGGNGLALLDQAFELDDAPGWERFYLVAGPEAFQVDLVMEAARKLAAKAGIDPPGSLPLSAPFRQAGLTLTKETLR